MKDPKYGEKKLTLDTPGGIKFIWTSSPPPPPSPHDATPVKVSTAISKNYVTLSLFLRRKPWSCNEGGTARESERRARVRSGLATHSYNPLLFIKLNGYLYWQRVSPPLKKNALICYQRQCCPSSQVWQPSVDSAGSLAPFLFEFKLSGSGDSPLLTIMVHQKAITISRGLSHKIRSLSRIVCRGQERPTGRKGTLRLDFQANTRPRIFILKPKSPQDTGRQ